MLKIPCPFCGLRNEIEFVHGGPVKTPRSADPSTLDDAEWVRYLTVVNNPVGPVEENWWHVRGCGGWFVLTRDTRSHDLIDGEST